MARPLKPTGREGRFKDQKPRVKNCSLGKHKNGKVLSVNRGWHQEYSTWTPISHLMQRLQFTCDISLCVPACWMQCSCPGCAARPCWARWLWEQPGTPQNQKFGWSRLGVRKGWALPTESCTPYSTHTASRLSFEGLGYKSRQPKQVLCRNWISFCFL